MISNNSEGRTSKRRSWRSAFALALALTLAAVAFSAVANPLLGRVVHWEIMAVIAPIILALSALMLRRS